MRLKTEETCSVAILTANSSTLNYPATNMLDGRLSRIFKTDSSTTATIVFDCAAAVDVTSIVIANHNISSGVTTLKLQGNATDSWGAPSVDETLTWSAGNIVKDITKVTYRYWRIHIVDAGNSDGFISIGRAWIGELYQTPSISPNISHNRTSESVKSISASGQSYQDTRYKYSSITAAWPILSHAEKAALIAIFDDIDIGTPFFVTFDETGSDLGTVYVTIDSEGLNFTLMINPLYYTSSINYREEV
jgi:hypothetical protein